LKFRVYGIRVVVYVNEFMVERTASRAEGLGFEAEVWDIGAQGGGFGFLGCGFFWFCAKN
jgi:hypothetical protein